MSLEKVCDRWTKTLLQCFIFEFLIKTTQLKFLIIDFISIEFSNICIVGQSKIVMYVLFVVEKKLLSLKLKTLNIHHT